MARPVVLVLPFAAADADAAYLAEAASDELRTALAQLPALAVQGRGTADHVRALGATPAAAATASGATVVVAGTVDVAPGRLQVRVRVATPTVPEGVALDAEIALAALGTGCAALAQAVARACGVAEGALAAIRPAPVPSAQPAVLESYLRGRYHTEQRPIGVKRAMEHFDRAIRMDGGVAGAYGALALLWANFGIFLALPPAIARERAREQALRALERDPAEPSARAALLTCATFYDWDLAAADAIGTELLAAHPSSVAARQVLLYAHAARGDTGAVRALAEEVARLDPLAVDPVNDAGFALLLVGEVAAAVARLRAHVAHHPRAGEVHRRLGLALLEAGDGDAARQHLEQSVALSRRHAWGVANLAAACARTGDAATARRLLAELVERAEGELIPAIALAEVHAELGEAEAAFAALDRALADGDYWLLALEVDPLLAPLRADPRFAAARARRAARPVPP